LVPGTAGGVPVAVGVAPGGEGPGLGGPRPGGPRRAGAELPAAGVVPVGGDRVLSQEEAGLVCFCDLGPGWARPAVAGVQVLLVLGDEFGGAVAVEVEGGGRLLVPGASGDEVLVPDLGAVRSEHIQDVPKRIIEAHGGSARVFLHGDRDLGPAVAVEVGH